MSKAEKKFKWRSYKDDSLYHRTCYEKDIGVATATIERPTDKDDGFTVLICDSDGNLISENKHYINDLVSAKMYADLELTTRMLSIVARI